MARISGYSIAACAALAVFAAAAPACAQTVRTTDFAVRQGELWRKTNLYELIAVEQTTLLDAPFEYDRVIPVLHSMAEVGANGFVFDVDGYSEDAVSINNRAMAALYEAITAIEWRGLAAIARIVPSDAPDDPAWREQAVRTVAETFRNEREIMYLLDCPGAAELAMLFKELAPRCTLIAPVNGDILLVDGEAPANAKQPVLVRNAIAKPNPKTHYYLPAGEESLAKIDAAMAAPVESQPWEPDYSALPKGMKEEGWIPLFNGKNFDGWYISGKPECWTIEDGCIKWVKRGGGIVRSRDRYDNFTLHIEFQINEGGNSGVFVRAPRTGRTSKIGMESQIEGDHGEPVTKTSTGSIYDVEPPLKNMSKPAGEWNTLEITIDGDHYHSVLNGETVQDRNLAEHPELKHRVKKGFIAVQDHGNPALFRNIWIKPL